MPPIRLEAMPPIHLAAVPPIHLAAAPPIHLAAAPPIHLAAVPPDQFYSSVYQDKTTIPTLTPRYGLISITGKPHRHLFRRGPDASTHTLHQLDR